MISINSYEDYCKSFKSKDSTYKARGELLHYVRSWFNSRVGESIESRSYTSLDDLTCCLDETKLNNDGLSKIVNRTFNAFQHLVKNMHEKIVRENVLLPIHKVREINNYGINWLSKRNGRTVREKLSGSNSMMAVKRRSSFDTGENRLLLAFAKQMSEIIELKEYCMPDKVSAVEEEFYDLSVQFLRVDDTAEIRRWENLPPNNTLLSDRYYSIIWRGWNDLQKLDSILKEDNDKLAERLKIIFAWKLLEHARQSFAFNQIPVLIDFDEFQLDSIIPNVVGLEESGDIISFCWCNTNDKCAIRIIYHEKEYILKFEGINIVLICDGKKLSVFSVTHENINSIVRDIALEIWDSSDKACTFSNKVESVVGKGAVIDIFAVRPDYILDGQHIAQVPFRIMVQQFTKYFNKLPQHYVISDAFAHAIYTNDDDTNVQIYTLNSVLKDPADGHAPMLVGMLREYLRVKKLTFIFPDIYNDFQLSRLRRSCRLFYSEVEAMPKSIACTFAFEQTETFKNNFNCGDCVIVLNLVNDRCTITLMESNYDENVAARLPDRKGIVWERHPSENFPAVGHKEDYSLGQQFIQKIRNDNFYNPGIIDKHYAVQSINCELNKLCLCAGENEWLPIRLKIAKQDEKLICNITDIVDTFIARRQNFIKSRPVHIISLTEKFIYTGICEFQTITNAQCLEGVCYYNKLADQVNESLWKDHLPDLAIKRFLGTFDLVKGQKIEPRYNNVIEIKINNTFTLIKGKQEYHFKLLQNDGADFMQFEAVVKHVAFPLKEDVNCLLQMTYNYGADDPYKLVFKPLNRATAGFSEAEVEWKPMMEYNVPDDDKAIPKFPKPKTWYDLQNWPSKDGTYTENLLESITKYLDRIINTNVGMDFSNMSSSLQRDNYFGTSLVYCGRFKGEDSVIVVNEKACDDSINIRNMPTMLQCNLVEDKDKRYDTNGRLVNWFVDKSGNNTARVDILIDNVLTKVLFYTSNFIRREEFYDGISHMTFKVYVNKNGMCFAKDIIAGTVSPRIYHAKKVSLPKNVITINEVSLSFKSWYHFHTVFNNARRIGDADCPRDFYNTIQKYCQILTEKFYEVKNPKKRLVLLVMLSLMTSVDCPDFYATAEQMLYNFQENKTHLNDMLGYILGDCSNEYQQGLLHMVLRLDDEVKKICLLSRAAWRNEEFILSIHPKILLFLFNSAIDKINEGELSGFDKLMFLEFMLATFRLRALNDKNINRTLSLNNPRLLKLYYGLEKMIDDEESLPVSRLTFDIKKSDVWINRNIPDFIYACLVYITGETGEGDIRIAEIVDR